MATDERRIEYIPLAELLTRLHPRNPKQHDIGAIVQSYQHHGYVANGVLDSRTGLFLAGHGRVEALSMMQKQKMEAPRGIRNGGADWLVPVQVGYESESDEAALAYLAADNKLTELGGWDEVALADMLQEIHNSGEIALEASGFDADDLDTLLNDLGMMEEPTPDPGAQVDRAAELQEKWQVQRGDVWQVGRHRVMCGDSTCAEDVDRLMSGVKADAVVTDPPFAVRNDGWDIFGSEEDFVAFTALWLGNIKPFANVIASFMADKNIPQLLEAADRNLLLYRRALIWRKPPGSQFAGASLDGFWFDFEIIQVFGKPSFSPRKDTQMACLEYRTITGQEHGCEKPIELLIDIIEGYSEKNKIVVDLFLGTGTVMAACEMSQRACFGIEIDPKYCAVILQRMSDFGLQPKRIDDE
jgi:DNA modification methylase